MDLLSGPLSTTRRDSLLLPSGARVDVGVATPTLPRWTGSASIDSFGGKPLFDSSGIPFFAELWILRLLESAGWSGRWVATYAAPKRAPRLLQGWNPRGIKSQISVPIDDVAAAADLKKVASANGCSFAGCWDVYAWRGSARVFVDAKQARKDRIRSTQLRWLESALRAGFGPGSFLIVEWKARASS